MLVRICVRVFLAREIHRFRRNVLRVTHAGTLQETTNVVWLKRRSTITGDETFVDAYNDDFLWRLTAWQSDRAFVICWLRVSICHQYRVYKIRDNTFTFFGLITGVGAFDGPNRRNALNFSESVVFKTNDVLRRN